MQIRNAANVLPDPVGAEIRVVRPARISGQPCSCGSVGVPKRTTNHSATSGCAQANETGISPNDMLVILAVSGIFANCSPLNLSTISSCAGIPSLLLRWATVFGW